MLLLGCLPVENPTPHSLDTGDPARREHTDRRPGSGQSHISIHTHLVWRGRQKLQLESLGTPEEMQIPTHETWDLLNNSTSILFTMWERSTYIHACHSFLKQQYVSYWFLWLSKICKARKKNTTKVMQEEFLSPSWTLNWTNFMTQSVPRCLMSLSFFFFSPEGRENLASLQNPFSSAVSVVKTIRKY